MLITVKNVMSPLTCIIIPSYTKAVTKVVDPTSPPSHYSRLSSNVCRILPFVDVEAKECFEHVSDKDNEEMENDRGSYRPSMHGSTLTTCAHYFMDINMYE
jgi:hypothetical protein